MKRTMIVLAAMLIGATAYGAEKPAASKMSPGHEMQKSPSSTTKGAFEYSPGKMKDEGTGGRARRRIGKFPGAIA